MARRLLARLTASAFVALTSVALSGGTAQGDQVAKPVGDAICAGNTIYTICVDDIFNKGRYTAKTGLAHPVPNVNLLFGGAVNSPATSHSSYRSFTTGTTYTQGSFSGSFNLSPFATVTLIGTTGVRTTYTLPGPPVTADELLIVQDVNVNGTTLADSNVAITTTIMNQGMTSVAMGIRYLWDFQIGLDDGPTFQAQSPDGPVLHFETEFTPPNFSFYKIVDNDTNPTSPTYQVFGTVNGPATLIPQPTPPTQLTYGCWPTSFGTSFDYSIGSPPRNVADQINDCTGGVLGGDSDVLYWWGRSSASALVLGPGVSTTTNALLFAAAPEEPPPFLVPTPGKVNLGGYIDSAGNLIDPSELLLQSGPLAGVGKATFGGNVQFRSGDPSPTGNVRYIDHVTSDDIKATSFSLLVIGPGACGTDTHAMIKGKATVNGVPDQDLQIDVDDCGEPGSQEPGTSPSGPDMLVISVTGPNQMYLNGGPLVGGNIQVRAE